MVVYVFVADKWVHVEDGRQFCKLIRIPASVAGLTAWRPSTRLGGLQHLGEGLEEARVLLGSAVGDAQGGHV